MASVSGMDEQLDRTIVTASGQLTRVRRGNGKLPAVISCVLVDRAGARFLKRRPSEKSMDGISLR